MAEAACSASEQNQSGRVIEAMPAEQGESKQAGMSAAAAEREARRVAEREARLAEALRANLKRRKEQARNRTTQNI
jgi:hypothetical protein